MKTLDLRGMGCPIALVQSKLAYRGLENNTILRVLIDSSAAQKDIDRFFQQQDARMRIIRHKDFDEYQVTKQEVQE